MILRRFTSGEAALAAEVFGATFEVRRVRILFVPVWDRAFVPGGRLLVWPQKDLHEDFAHAPLRVQAVFVHELTHVWQAQRGVFLPFAKIRAGDAQASYAYDLVQGPGFSRLNIEQQAMVVEHAFLASRGVATQHPPELYAQARSEWLRA